MKKRMIFFVAVLPSFSKAEDNDDEKELTRLEDVVVTATRSMKSVDEVTADVGIITREDIQTSTASNVDDILRKLGGVDIRRPSDMGLGPPMVMNIRGIGGGKDVLLMMDGVPLNSPMTGFMQTNQIQLSSIERIEVVKGAFSSLYGSNAMGGVINIISRRPKTDGFHITPILKYGSFDFVETGASIFGRNGKFSYSLDGNYRRVDNHFRRDKNVTYMFDPETGGFNKDYRDVNENSEYHDMRFFTRLDYDFSGDTGITFTGNYSEGCTEMGKTTFLPEPRDSNIDHSFHFLNLIGHTVVKDRLALEMRVYTNYEESLSETEHIIENPEPFAAPFLFEYGEREYWGRDTGFQIKVSMPLGDFNYLTAGVDSSFMSGIWENRKEDGAIIDHAMDESINSQAIYLQNETDLFSCLTVTLGVRYDIPSESDDSLCPKLGLLYKVNDRVLFRGSVGRAFRAPNLNELYTPTWMMIPGIPFASNPDLDPEKIWSCDLGTSIQLTDDINFKLTGFYSKAKDLIHPPIFRGAMRYENLNEAKTDGFEVDLEGKLMSWLNFYVNYTYTHSVDKEKKRLDNAYLHKANAGLRAVRDLGSKNRVSASLDARYSGSTFYQDMMTFKKIDVDPYTVLDFSLRFDLNNGLGIIASATNLTDEDYVIHGFYNLGPERCYWAGVDYRF